MELSFPEMVFNKKSIDILIALYEKSMGVRELISEVGGSATTIEQRLRELKDVGLIEERASRSFPFKRELKLTEKGRKLAEILNEAGRITLDPHTNIFPRCPKCEKGWLILKFEAYKEEGRYYIALYFICPECNTKYILASPIYEVL